MKKRYSDQEVVQAFFDHDERILNSFFSDPKLNQMLEISAYNGCCKSYHIDIGEILGFLYMELTDKDFKTLRNYKFSGSLMAYLSKVVFYHYRGQLKAEVRRQTLVNINSEVIERKGDSLPEEETLRDPRLEEKIDELFEDMRLMGRQKHKEKAYERYIQIIQEVDLKERKRTEVAKEMGISVGVLNTKHALAIQKLSYVAFNHKED